MFRSTIIATGLLLGSLGAAHAASGSLNLAGGISTSLSGQSGSGIEGTLGTTNAAVATLGESGAAGTLTTLSPTGVISASASQFSAQGSSTLNAFTTGQVENFGSSMGSISDSLNVNTGVIF